MTSFVTVVKNFRNVPQESKLKFDTFFRTYHKKHECGSFILKI